MKVDELSGLFLPVVGGGLFNFEAELAKKPLVLVFYSNNCPTCQFALPFVEELYQRYGDSRAKFVAIAQADEPETVQFRQEYGLNFSVAMDKEPYPVSQVFDFQVVPAIGLIGQDGRIIMDFIGFQKAEFEKLNQLLAGQDETVQPLFSINQGIPEFRPG